MVDSSLGLWPPFFHIWDFLAIVNLVLRLFGVLQKMATTTEKIVQLVFADLVIGGLMVSTKGLFGEGALSSMLWFIALVGFLVLPWAVWLLGLIRRVGPA